MMSTPDTDLLDPEKMREAIAAIVALREQRKHGEPWDPYAMESDDLHELNRRLLAEKIRRGNQHEAERLLHEAFVELEGGKFYS